MIYLCVLFTYFLLANAFGGGRDLYKKYILMKKALLVYFLGGFVFLATICLQKNPKRQTVPGSKCTLWQETIKSDISNLHLKIKKVCDIMWKSTKCTNTLFARRVITLVLLTTHMVCVHSSIRSSFLLRINVPYALPLKIFFFFFSFTIILMFSFAITGCVGVGRRKNIAIPLPLPIITQNHRTAAVHLSS